MSRARKTPPERRTRARLLGGVALALLFLLRAIGTQAHLAHEHDFGLRAHGEHHHHAHHAPLPDGHRHAPVHHEEGDHSAQDHLADLLSQRAPEFASVALVPLEPAVVLAAPARSSPLSESPTQRFPRARSPAPPTLRGPPAV